MERKYFIQAISEIMDSNGPLLEKTLKSVGKVDILITEGTTFTRPQVKSQTEEDLALEMIEKTKKYNQVLLLCSTTNIDRAVVMTKVRK